MGFKGAGQFFARNAGHPKLPKQRSEEPIRRGSPIDASGALNKPAKSKRRRPLVPDAIVYIVNGEVERVTTAAGEPLPREPFLPTPPPRPASRTRGRHRSKRRKK